MKVNKSSMTYKSIKPLASQLLTGEVLCIDPSTGSTGSMPGWAVYKNGELDSSGLIEVDHRLNRSLRLYEIARTIREDFTTPDILVVEYIPPVSYRGGMNGIALMALQKAIGAIIGALPFENLIEVPASAWKAAKDDKYEKTDHIDAIYIGKYVMAVARHIVEEDEPIKPKTRRKK